MALNFRGRGEFEIVGTVQASDTYDRGLDFVDVLQASARNWPDRPAFTYLMDGESETTSVTFGELDRQARAVAVHLTQLGVGGQRALLLYPSGLEFVAALFGCLYANVVAIPAFPPRRNRNMLRLHAISSDSGASVALTINDVSQRMGSELGDMSDLTGVRWIATDTLDVSVADTWSKPKIEPQSMAVLQYTSGSTGNPKGVVLSHGCLMANCQLITKAFEAATEEIIATWLPTYHDMGLIGGILEPIYTASPVVMMSPMAFLQKPVRWLQAISRYRVTVSGGPNFAYDLCNKKVTEEQIDELDLSSWTLAFNGAEPVRGRTLERFVQKFGRCGFRSEAFYPCYGMAETTLMVTGGQRELAPLRLSFDDRQLGRGIAQPVAAGQPGHRELVGCGSAAEHHEVIIVDPETCEPLEDGRVGEIWVHGPSVCLGYLDKPELNAATFQARLRNAGTGRYLRTGDLGFRYQGQLFVNGRIKDLVIIRGVNRYPQDIEVTVEHAHPLVRTGSAAAFAVDGDADELLVIVAEVERVASSDWEGVIQAIRERVALAHDVSPDAVVLIRAGSIPKTSSGKIQRHACREGFLADSLIPVARWQQSPEPSTAQESRTELRCHCSDQADDMVAVHQSHVLDVVYNAVRKVAKERARELYPHSNIVALGLDSLERVDIIHLIESELNITFSDTELLQIETCGEVAALAMRRRTEDGELEQSDNELQYQIEDMPEYRQLKRMQAAFEASGYSSPYFGLHEGICRATTVVDGRELINFSSYNYLGMSGDQDVSRAAQEAIAKYGTSVSASRLVSGERPIHRALERQIADLIGVNDAVVFVGGHSTNESVIGHLLDQRDLILHDSLAHNSIVQGAILSGAERRAFPHNDSRALERMLANMRSRYRRVLIAIEGVYSMDGDFPHLPSFIAVAKRHKALLMVDEAHSAGTMGTQGRGIGEHFGVDARDVDIWMGTLSKSFGSCGGYIAGSSALVEYLRYTTPGFVYSVGMPPANAAAALASIQKMLSDPGRVARCQRRAALFLKLCRQLGLETGTSSETPIVPVIVGNSRIALALSVRLSGTRHQCPTHHVPGGRGVCGSAAILRDVRTHGSTNRTGGTGHIRGIAGHPHRAAWARADFSWTAFLP